MTKKISIYLLGILLLAAVMMVPSFAGSEDAEFIYPADKTVIFVSKVRTIGKTPGNRHLSLYVKNRSGESRHELNPADSYFNLEVPLHKGKNTVTLSTGSVTYDTIEIIHADHNLDPPSPDGFSPYFLHSKNNLTDECELCHPRNKDKALRYKHVVQQVTCITDSCHPKFNQAKFLHGPFAAGSCVECHNPHGSGNQYFLKESRAALCFICHTDAEEMANEGKYVHFPVEKGECTACHDPHKSNLEYHLKRETMVDLCAGCHGNVITSHKILHDPVASGDCNVCHLPHTSDHKGLLTDGGKDLCFNCHEVRKEEFNSKYVHGPVTNGCTDCHDPHGSATVYQLHSRKDENGSYITVEQPFTELCLGCHRKLDPEVADQIEHSTIPHDPVVKGKCIVCHTPHSTDHKKQLNAPLSEICFSCHQEIKELITGSKYKHGPVRTNDCAQAHISHGSNNAKLLRSNFSLKYSDNFSIGNFDLCFSCHNPEAVLEQMTETTGFRNGRRNLHYVHVKTKGRNCQTCHEIHASDQEMHIREEIPFKKRFMIELTFTKTATGGGCVKGCHKPKKYDREEPEDNK